MTILDDRPVVGEQQQATDVAEPTTAELLLAHDQTRDRSQQRELGWSEIGGCRKRAGFWLHGYEPTDPGGSLPAVMGTAIHDTAAEARRQVAQPGDLIEHEVRFAGILGHLDWYTAATCTLGDLKTTSKVLLDRYMVDGPDDDQLWQANGYAAALIRSGRPVHRIVIEYLARDTGDTWRWVGKPDPAMVRAALAWVAAVRDAEFDMLARDHAPTSARCRNCPFRTACWDGAVTGRDPRSVIYTENPDTAALWVDAWQQACDDETEAAKRKEHAKGVLDALRPNDEGRSAVLDVGLPDVGLRWSVSHPRNLDHGQVRADYHEAGVDVPTKRGTQVRMSLAPLPKTKAGEST